ncbi:hypothetical protein GCM10007242_27050 [Pigmentiphaga litoralis]|nr:hypothetical protein GCM10007242_27050 [Pigmentiphaga litoralis]
MKGTIPRQSHTFPPAGKLALASFCIDISDMTDTNDTNDITANSDTLPPLPDHLSIDPRSPHHVAAAFERDIGIRFNDVERTDVEEYCISERWIRVRSAKAKDRRGQPLLIKLKGKVEAFYR